MNAVSTITILVRSTEIDVNGHVNNAKFLEYLEWGREDWYEQLGLDYKTLFNLGVVTVVARVEADYLQEALQNDQLAIRTWVKSVGNRSFRMAQTISNQDEQEVLRAEFVIVTVDTETRKSTPVPDEIRQNVYSSEENS